jgi:hypothetical protein
MAQKARLPEIQTDLLNLATRFERVAALLEDSGGSRTRKH